MVQSSSYKNLDPRKKKLDEYCKLPSYPISNRDSLAAILHKAKHEPPSSATKSRLICLVQHYKRGLISYFACTTEELKTFCAQRNLPLPQEQKPSKEIYVNTLEQADEGTTFHHFLDLPAELRSHVYAHYFSSLPRLEQPVQPPISRVSRLVRQESLPIFYSTCTFVLNMCEPRYPETDILYCSSDDSSDDDSDDDMLFTKATKGEFFASIDDGYLEAIREICIEKVMYPMSGLPNGMRGSIHIKPNEGRISFRKRDLAPESMVKGLSSHVRKMRKRSEKQCFTRADIDNLKNLIRNRRD